MKKAFITKILGFAKKNIVMLIAFFSGNNYNVFCTYR